MSPEGNNGVEIRPLLGLSLEGGDEGLEVGDVVFGLGPGGPGQDLLLQGELSGAADAEDAVVGFLGRQALEGGQDGLVLFADQVVVALGLGQCAFRKSQSGGNWGRAGGR